MNLPESLVTSFGSIASWAWNTSLIILLPALVVLALGRWKSFPARWRGWLGAVVLLRLLLPWVPEVSWRPAWAAPLQSVQVAKVITHEQKAAPTPAEIAQNLKAAGRIQVAAEDAKASDVPLVVTGTGIDQASSTSFSIPSLATLAMWIWFAGVMTVATWILYSHAVLHRLITRCRTRADASLHRDLEWCTQRMGMKRACDLWVVRGLPTVAVHGWLRPVILVPEGLRERFSAEEIRGMFLHELAHVRRGDLIVGRAMLAVCALHWFNPLVWLLARRMRADAELECDRIALDRLTHAQRSHYGEALLKTLEVSIASVPLPAPAVPFFRHAKEIQTRIQMIALPRSSAVARYAAFLIAPALACLTLTTTGRADDENPKAGEEKVKGDGEEKKTGPREGEDGAKRGPRDGEVKKEGARDGEAKKEGPRDGEMKKEGPRDGEARKAGPRDGEQAKNGPRDGEARKEGARDGEQKKAGPRDGEQPKSGLRDGEGQKKGPRDGEARKEGARDGEGAARRGPRDGEGAKSGAEGDAVVLRLLGKGEKVSIRNKTMPLGSLRGYLSQNGAGMTLLVQADDDVPAKAVLEVVDAARDNGVEIVSSDSEEGRETRTSAEER